MSPHAQRSPRGPALRASDAERASVADFLRHHAGEGRLSTDELEDRVARAFRAVTVADLEALIADLPGSPFASSIARSDRPRPRSGVLVALGIPMLLVAPGVAWALWWTGVGLAIAALAVLLALTVALGPVVALPIAGIVLLRRRRRAAPPGWRPSAW
jgi:uncharacterized protein DUF1707